MGSVLYLDRGMGRRRNGGAAAARVQPAPAPSLLRPGYNCWAVSRADRVAVLVDAADYYKAFYEAALRARHSITILGGESGKNRIQILAMWILILGARTRRRNDPRARRRSRRRGDEPDRRVGPDLAYCERCLSHLDRGRNGAGS